MTWLPLNAGNAVRCEVLGCRQPARWYRGSSGHVQCVCDECKLASDAALLLIPPLTTVPNQ